MRKHPTNQSSAAQSKSTPAEIADQICRALKAGGSAEHATGVQWFFKDEIKSHGWYTAALRRAVRGFRRDLRKEHGLDFLVDVADQLFSSSVLEEKVAAVFLLEELDPELGDREFRRFESWLDRIRSWADHDALVHSLIAPMVVAKPARAKTVLRWATSPNRWHRRAACVALIKGARVKMFFPSSPTHFSLIRMTLCKKDWAGCSAKPRSSMPNAQCRIS
jgi:3-methyladenine DNA glycosylase AlkD